MPWNWQLPTWPNFLYDASKIVLQERQFLLGVGNSFAFLKNIGNEEYKQFVVEIMSIEGLKSSQIEGEILDRESLQSLIKKHFGLVKEAPLTTRAERKKEAKMAELLCSVYETFDLPLTHEMLQTWHAKLFENDTYIADRGKYRTHDEPMQIVSSRLGSPRVFFEAPPSGDVPLQMEHFLQWFSCSYGAESILARAAIAHLYFESIHPFEDGNGRIGRAIVEKILSQGVGRPVLIAVSKVFEKERKEYYKALERCNTTLDVNDWVEFFARAVLQAQKESLDLLYFLIAKSKLLIRLDNQINERQKKALLRLFEEGPEGFVGGLSAEKYIAITKCSRATATRDLTDLVEKAALKKTGELRHTRYWLNLM